MTILDRPDFDPERDLSKGPYERPGFSQELQRRIEDSIERKSRIGWIRAPFIASAIALVTAGLVFVGWNGWPWERQTTVHQTVATIAPKDFASEPSAAVITAPRFNSGVLIGLRTDYERKDVKSSAADNADSSYRTLFVAPLNGQLDVAAEGKGILLPYGQQFWKIDAVTKSAGSGLYSTLVAHPATKPLPEPVIAGNGQELVRHSERLLYAGNKYVSLEQSETTKRNRKPLQAKRVWVKTLEQLDGSMTLPASAPSSPAISPPATASAAAPVSVERKYVGYSEIFGQTEKGASRDQWAIVRRAGNWVPNAAKTHLDGDQESYSLTPVSLALPDAVVSHDQLCCTWADLRRVQPDAVDALSSPEKDFVAIITPSSIYFYEDRNGKLGESPLLIINLNDNEKLVMAQWATGDYVENWVKASRNFLKKS